MTTSPQDVLAIAEGVVQLKRKFFRDVWFHTTRTGEAFSKLIDQPGGYLRFSLPEGSVLHFGSLRIWMRDAQGDLFTVEEMQDIQVGSIYAGTELHTKRLLDFENRHLAFHTDKHDATLTLAFEPGLVHRIEINNRDDIHAVRAWDLRIEISEDGTTWREIYHHPTSVARFRAMSSEALGADYPMALVEDVLTIMAAAYDNPRSVRDPFTQFGRAHGIEARAALAIVLDRDVLKPRQFEMTSSHGAQHTFRFWSEEEKNRYLRFAVAAAARLQDQGDPAFLGYGTLLGMVREGDFIAHDDDIDLVVVMDRNPGESMHHLMGRFEERLQEAGFKVMGNYPNHRHIHLDGELKVLDAFIATREAGQIYFNPARTHEMPEKMIFPLAETEFKGVMVQVPADILGHLAALYGPDWRTPMPAFVHGWKPLT